LNWSHPVLPVGAKKFLKAGAADNRNRLNCNQDIGLSENGKRRRRALSSRVLRPIYAENGNN
jgi:hypothetical protein